MARQQAKQEEESRQAALAYKEKQEASKKIIAQVMPAFRACLEEATERLAITSHEAANLVAIAVLESCRSYEQTLDRAYRITGWDAGGETVRAVNERLMPRIIGRVVTIRAKSGQTYGQSPDGRKS